MTILEKFDVDSRFKRLARRRNNFRAMIEHVLNFVEKNGVCNIIETGSAWDLDNWEGQGQSTLIWDWLLEQTKEDTFILNALSIDITPQSTENAKKQTKLVEFITADSVKTLNELEVGKLENTGLLYLDSYDWSPEKNLESSFHHIAELTSCWKNLPSGCMIVVDDRHGDFKGKHWMVESYLTEYLKIQPIFKNHQIGWIKP